MLSSVREFCFVVLFRGYQLRHRVRSTYMGGKLSQTIVAIHFETPTFYEFEGPRESFHCPRSSGRDRRSDQYVEYVTSREK